MEYIEKNFEKVRRILNGEEEFPLFLFPSKHEAAAQVYKEILYDDPNNFDALMGLAHCYRYSPKKMKDALLLFKQASELRPEDPAPYYEIGLTILNDRRINYRSATLGGYEAAIPFFTTALELGYTRRSFIFNHLGTIYSGLQEYEAALKWFQRAAKASEEEHTLVLSTYFLAAEAAEQVGDHAETLKWLEIIKKKSLVGDDEVDELDLRIRNLKVLIENRKKAL
jgi:tetratricopeptide (TPR) repeat protein